MASDTPRLDGRTWWRLSWADRKELATDTAAQFKEDDVGTLAAAVTLRLVLALVPSLIAGVAIATFFVTGEQIEELVLQAGDFIPDESQAFVISTLQAIVDQEAGGTAVIGVLAGLFAATSGAVALMKALNVAFDIEEPRPFVRQRLVALGIVVALALSLAGMFIVLVFGSTIVRLVVPEQVLDTPVSLLITAGRYLLAAGILMLFFSTVFRLGPNRPAPHGPLATPGGVLGVTGWLLLSYGFSIYVRTAGNYSAYGAAAGVFILLIWLNYSFTVLLMGAELDNQIEQRFIRRGLLPPPGDPSSPGERGGGEVDEFADKDLPAPALSAAGDPAAVDDPDAVDDDMPRHPGLVPAGDGPGTGAAGQAADRPARPGIQPRLSGVAAHTTGASLAGRLWARTRR